MILLVNGPASRCGEMCNPITACTEARRVFERPRVPVVIYTGI
jgi:hypothetical protein